jgi:hypothetical protein
VITLQRGFFKRVFSFQPPAVGGRRLRHSSSSHHSSSRRRLFTVNNLLDIGRLANDRDVVAHHFSGGSCFLDLINFRISDPRELDAILSKVSEQVEPPPKVFPFFCSPVLIGKFSDLSPLCKMASGGGRRNPICDGSGSNKQSCQVTDDICG